MEDAESVRACKESGREEGCSLPLFSSEVSPLLLARYSRQMVVDEVGAEGQKKLLASKILVVGCGGLGAPALMYLAAMGVGCLGIADGDVVEHSNLNRQVLFSEGAVGGDKVDRAVEQLARLNSGCTFRKHPKISRENVWEECRGYDMVVDCGDSRSLRYLLSDYASVEGIPFVCGSSLRWEGSVYYFAQTCYRCVYPVLSAKPLDTCASAGIIGSVCGVVGSAIATEVLKAVLGVQKESCMLFFNALKNKWITVPLSSKRPCCICTKKKHMTKEEIKSFIGVEEDVYNPPKEVPRMLDVGLGLGLDTWANLPDGGAVGGADSNTTDIDTDRGAVGITTDRGADRGADKGTVSIALNTSLLDKQSVEKKNTRDRDILWSDITQNMQEYLIVDIRTKAEHRLISIPGSVSYPLSDIVDSVQKAFAHLSKKADGRKLAFFCRNGTTSRRFADLFKGYNIQGGMQKYLEEHR
ncbi:hypothetical protein NECID01_1620 [Nematocida sp. AWRm77]|nr:hypothetical protein NECID01_1620 [Nematocida sp. AWRm77]